MKSVMQACLFGSILICGMGAQDAPVLRQGVSVQMAVAGHAVEMRAADQPDATVVAITAEGKVFVGIQRTEPAALGSLRDSTVYVKVDSRTPYQDVLAVLDGLRRGPAPPTNHRQPQTRSRLALPSMGNGCDLWTATAGEAVRR